MIFHTLKRKLGRNYHDYGLTVSVQKTLSYLLEPIYENRELVIYQIDLTNVDETVKESSEFIIRPINIHDDNVIEQIERMEEWLEGKLRTMLEKGRLCFAVLHDEELLGFYLASLKSINIPRFKLIVELNADEVWGNQISIHRDYRRKGLATYLKYYVYQELKKIGITKVFGHVSKGNVASLKSVNKFNPTVLGDLQYYKIMNSEKIRFTRLSSENRADAEVLSGKKYIHFRDKGQELCKINTTDFDRTFLFE